MPAKPHPDSFLLRPLAVSIKTACAMLGVGTTTLWRLIRSNDIDTVRIGRRRLVKLDSLFRLVAEPEQRASSRGPKAEQARHEP